jgi:hypothetical protein
VDKRIDVLATALKAGMTVHDLAELELAYAPPYGSAKDPVNLAGMAAENVIAGDVSVAQWNEVALLDAGTTLLLDLPKRGNNVRSAALGQFASKDFKCRSGFGQEVWRRFHKESTWMFIPCLCDPRIDGRRLFGGLDAERILMVVTGSERWCAQMNDGIVTLELLIKSGADGREKVAGPKPVCAPINCASIAQDNRWFFGIGNTFELALNIKDRPLCCLPDFRRIITGESSKQDSGRFRKHFHVFAKVLAYQLQNCGLPSTRAARKYNSASLVSFAANHRFSACLTPNRLDPGQLPALLQID